MSKTVKNWTQWLKESRFSYLDEVQVEQTINWLFAVRDKVLQRAKLNYTDTLLDIGTGGGLLAFGAYDYLKENGNVIASDKFKDCISSVEEFANNNNVIQNFEVLLSGAEDIKLPNNSVDVVVMRSVLVHILDKQPCFNEFYRVLKEGGRLSIFEPIISSNTKYYELIEPSLFRDFDKIKEAEDKITNNCDDPLTNFTKESLYKNVVEAGFKNIDLDIQTESSTYIVTKEMIEPWFNTPPSPGTQTMKEKFLNHLEPKVFENFIIELSEYLDGKEITVNTNSAYIYAEK